MNGSILKKNWVILQKKLSSKKCAYFFPKTGGLTASQFPVFTLYIQKVCLAEGRPCDRAWTFEKVSGFAMDKYAKKRGRVNSREQCEVLCLTETEFPCR